MSINRFADLVIIIMSSQLFLYLISVHNIHRLVISCISRYSNPGAAALNSYNSLCVNICKGERKFTLSFCVLAYCQRARKPPSPCVNTVYCECVQYGRGENLVMELFQENLEWKVCKGKNNNERKQRYKALLNNRTHIRAATF